MQHDGWVETVIQSKMAGQDLTFRTLAVSGDTVTSRPRSKGVPKPEDYLATCKADVIFVFFGYNESFGGQAKLPQFKTDLTTMVGNYQVKRASLSSIFLILRRISMRKQKNRSLLTACICFLRATVRSAK
jgi:hypothetical protein